MYWGNIGETMKKPHYDVPFILSEELFPVHMGFRDELLDRYNSPDKAERRKWRAILNNDVTPYLFRMIRQTIQQGGRIVAYIYGEGGIGKSWLIIALKIVAYEVLEELGLKAKIDVAKDGRITRIGVYTKSYVGTVQAVRDAEAENLIYIMQQDEHPKTGGAGKIDEKDNFDNCLSELRWKRHNYFIASTSPPPTFTDLSFSIQVVSRNPELAGGTALGIYHYGSGREKGYVMVRKNENYPEVYDDYENNIKPQRQAEIASSGGAESAMNNAETMQKARKIVAKLIEMEPCVPKLKVEMINAAIDACGETVATYGDRRGSVFYHVKKLYGEYLGDNRKPMSKPRPSESTEKLVKAKRRDMGRESVEEGDKWEAECISTYMPKLFKECKITGRDSEGKKLKGQPDLLGISPTELLLQYVDLPSSDHLKVFVALEHGNHPDVDQYSVSIREEGNNKIEREVFATRLLRNIGENVALLLLYKETGRNQVYFNLIDIDKPRTVTIHFDTDKYLQI